MATPAVQLDVEGIEVRLSSPDKVYFPELGISKLDLANYAMGVGEGFLAGLKMRPTTLERWPGGVRQGMKLTTRAGGKGDAFYQKRAPEKRPEWVDVAEVKFPSGRPATAITPSNLATIIWAMNLGTLRFHPWPVSAPEVDLVDQLRIDLDPQPGTDFRDAVAAALELRTVMMEFGLEPYPKTSGGRGVHVFCMIEPVPFVDARHAVIAIGRELARRMPAKVSVDWWKEERGERIFVDFNQMARDRLMASPYSVRPVPQARVSAPLTWDELPDAHPDDFTVLTMADRYRERGDVWAPLYASTPQSLDAVLERYGHDIESGLTDMPYPPEYPKMPGEPPRVQPSKQRRPHSDYSSPTDQRE
ncbi:DNA primase small subunit domain-containing protein [Propionimicrobium sp. PCR01-08-3]|uniref:DNA polymerase domain-containing protein n=1 Tax=Propionimicrobium sp. PCR01-08-3 TaxID=3052086 RepID=UPI00255CE3E5|nr:DNA primase small subunit domain-containing protein [Propionimicrobium sp. PCR01-08-3]WIY81398.1 ATP-dependent DNA ligase [Propionimicrobium sp. PCR01-08-3]